MERVRLGRSGLIVSRIGIGTMNFGSQLAERESHAILDQAFAAGINFVDTAEMYASPPTPESYGLSEEHVGGWLVGKPRDSVILATKIVGPPDATFQAGRYVRGGTNAFDRHHFARAVEGSLRRLRTDYIDLYQTHWPDRRTPLEVQLDAIARIVESGKVRCFGVSNESPWGLTRLVAGAAHRGTPGPVSTQNVLSLLEHHEYDSLVETCREERVGYIAFSPLAMGLLSGKYADGKMPEGSRLALYERYRRRYSVPAFHDRVQSLTEAARKAGIPLAQMAFAWALSRPEVAIVLTSANNRAQLESAIAAASLDIDFNSILGGS